MTVEKDKKVSLLEKQNIVHAMTYFPFFIGAIVMFFLAETNKEKLRHHVMYSLIMSFIMFVLLIILNGFFASVTVLGYWVLSGFFAYRAYEGKEIEVEFLDIIEDKIYELTKKK